MTRCNNYKFESTQQYLHWCAAMVNRIYTASFTMENEKLVALAAEVSSKLDISEGYDLIKADAIEGMDNDKVGTS